MCLPIILCRYVQQLKQQRRLQRLRSSLVRGALARARERWRAAIMARKAAEAKQQEEQRMLAISPSYAHCLQLKDIHDQLQSLVTDAGCPVCVAVAGAAPAGAAAGVGPAGAAAGGGMSASAPAFVPHASKDRHTEASAAFQVTEIKWLSSGTINADFPCLGRQQVQVEANACFKQALYTAQMLFKLPALRLLACMATHACCAAAGIRNVLLE